MGALSPFFDSTAVVLLFEAPPPSRRSAAAHLWQHCRPPMGAPPLSFDSTDALPWEHRSAPLQHSRRSPSGATPPSEHCRSQSPARGTPPTPMEAPPSSLEAQPNPTWPPVARGGSTTTMAHGGGGMPARGGRPSQLPGARDDASRSGASSLASRRECAMGMRRGSRRRGSGGGSHYHRRRRRRDLVVAGADVLSGEGSGMGTGELDRFPLDSQKDKNWGRKTLVGGST